MRLYKLRPMLSHGVEARKRERANARGFRVATGPKKAEVRQIPSFHQTTDNDPPTQVALEVPHLCRHAASPVCTFPGVEIGDEVECRPFSGVARTRVADMRKRLRTPLSRPFPGPSPQPCMHQLGHGRAWQAGAGRRAASLPGKAV